MKKRLLLLPLFIVLLLPIVIAPSNYNYHSNDYRISDAKYTYKENNIETTRTFLILNDKGPDYYRTFESFNKARLNRGSNYPSKNQRGIYRDFFDVDQREDSGFSTSNCPEGWECKKG